MYIFNNEYTFVGYYCWVHETHFYQMMMKKTEYYMVFDLQIYK